MHNGPVATDFGNLLGGAWLAERYGLQLTQQPSVSSSLAARRASYVHDGTAREQYPLNMRPEPGLKGHLTFHLKHEPIHLELLARLFEAIDPADLEAWVLDEPTGGYAHRAGFLYEWITGRRLGVPDAVAGQFVDAINDELVVAASPGNSTVSRRWRVRDNMPGTPAFCPVVRKHAGLDLDVPGLLAQLRAEFDEDLLMRAAVWMTLRESRSSFEIEGEGGRVDRIQRFANVLGRRTGRGEVPLGADALARLQGEILGESTTLRSMGLRQSPVFVGEYMRYQEVVHYIAPPAQAVGEMLQGLQVFLQRTAGQSPAMRSAVASFGFVYIHPLADGNGRVHRFLVNDILRRDGAVPEPFILPISALIMSDAGERRAYDRVLEVISDPLMETVAGTYRFGEIREYPDGVHSNLEFDGDHLAKPVWQYPDFTRHTAYLADVLARTVSEHMRDESLFMRSHSRARAAIKEVIEMPDQQADRVLRSMETNKGALTNAMAKEIPALARDGVWEQLVEVVRVAFEGMPEGDTTSLYDPNKPPAERG